MANPINFAFKKPATASFSEPGHPPAYAVDGTVWTTYNHYATRWCDYGDTSAQGKGWLCVDLILEHRIDTVQLQWESGSNAHWGIEASTDNTNWTQLVDVPEGTYPCGNCRDWLATDAPMISLPIDSTDSWRYVRMRSYSVPAVGSDSTLCCHSCSSLYDFEVFGTV